ncbi:MAG: MarC family protein, partial [Myxococcota bacterium]
MDTAVHFTTVLMAFFAIMNPIANTPLFLGLTEGLDGATRNRVALRGVLLAFAIVAAFAVAGRAIFDLFGITLPAFRIAGGLLVALVGYHMLQGEASSVHAPAEGDVEGSRDAALDLAVSPLALPVLAGPGTIATAMNFAAESTLPEVTRVVSAFAVVCLFTWLAFR